MRVAAVAQVEFFSCPVPPFLWGLFQQVRGRHFKLRHCQGCRELLQDVQYLLQSKNSDEQYTLVPLSERSKPVRTFEPPEDEVRV